MWNITETKGETSAGKSTLINKILGKRIFQGDNLESTSTICKIRNSEKITLIVEHKSGKTETRDLTDKCDMETQEGIRTLRKILNDLTNLTDSTKSKEYKNVDIGFPIPFLKDGVILVDTPGIGGSGEVSDKVMEYLPNAVSFVFVINVGSAGGMQKDRLPEILRSLVHLSIDNEMPCFDPRDVLFVTNKWDTITSCDSDSDDEEDRQARQVEKTWRDLKSKIKSNWSEVKEENIFKMSLKDVGSKKKNDSTEQFIKFQEALQSNIGKAENVRIVQHLSFLHGVLISISKVLRARLDLNKMDEGKQAALAKRQQEILEKITEEIEEINEKMKMKVGESIKKTAQTCYNYMLSDENKELILNPIGEDPILEVPYDMFFTNEITSRLERFVEGFLKSKEVSTKFTEIKDELVAFYKAKCLEICGMENDWVDEASDAPQNEIYVSEDDELSTGAFVGVAVATSPIWIPLLVAGLGLVIGAFGISLALSPFTIPLTLFLGRTERKKKIVEEEYNDFREHKVRNLVRNHLTRNTGAVLEKLIDKVTLILKRRIEALDESTKQLLNSRKEILAKRNAILVYARKIKTMEEKCLILQRKLN
uniref:Uncharacterized protein LOC111117580 isoform X3 n=1 Tax=Crassostrea virginica TaxID=6565 RepID=A0A8B8CBB9_CRAVI|nr:uncharacterized protein LOC111117580 isoform X3 [Crassostrea virginica]